MKKLRFTSKLEFREYCKQRSLPKNRIKKEYLVRKKLQNVIKLSKAKNILLYISLQNEIDTLKLLKHLRANTNICVPFMQGVSFKMVKFRLPLFKKKFNIKEPKNSFCILPKLDLAIVPVLGVDGELKRIGFGKGMYDRFFESLDYSCRAVFVQLQECRTEEKLCESHDIEADLYITPHKNIIKRGNNDNRSKYSSSCCYSKWNSRILNSKKIRCSKL